MQEEKGATEDDMAGWHHRLNRQEFKETAGDSERRGKPGVLQSMGFKESDPTWQLNKRQSEVIRLCKTNTARYHSCCAVISRSVLSDSLRPHGL